MWDAPDDRWTPRDILDHSPTERQSHENFYDLDIEHFCAAVVHPDTGETITKYKKLANDPNNAELRELWQTAMGKEVRRMAQGDDKQKTPQVRITCLPWIMHKL